MRLGRSATGKGESFVNRPVTRRDAIHQIGLLGIGAAAAACGAGPTEGNETIDLPTSCVFTPTQVAGPYFLDTGLLRSDITEDRRGYPLQVHLQLVDVDQGCAPIRDAAIEVWHSDADGAYSGFDIADGSTADAEGTTFLRGHQMTDGSGRADFSTIYPGWYPIRTIHVHVMVLIDGIEQVTTQLYFDQDVNDRIMSQAPYDTRGPQPVRNADDGLVGDRLGELSFDLTESRDGLDASYLLGIARPA